MNTAPYLTLRKTIGTLAAIIFLFVLILVFLTIQAYNKNRQDDLTLTKQATDIYASQIIGQFAHFKSTAEFLYQELILLEEETLKETDITSALKRTANNFDQYYSFGVAFEPEEVETEFAKLHLYAPFIVQGDDKIHRIDSYYDYSNCDDRSSNNWYSQAKQLPDGWGSALKEAAHDNWVLRYTKKLYRSDNSVRGIVFLDIELNRFRGIIENFDLWHNGYAIVANTPSSNLANTSNTTEPQCLTSDNANDGVEVLYHSLVGTEVIKEHLDNDFAMLNQEPPEFIQEVEEQGLAISYPSNTTIYNRLTGANAWFNRSPLIDGLSLITIMDHSTGVELPCRIETDFASNNQGTEGCESLDTLNRTIRELRALDPIDSEESGWAQLLEMDSESGRVTLIVSITFLIALVIAYKAFDLERHTMKRRKQDAILISLVMTLATITVCFFQYRLESNLTTSSTAISNSAMVKNIVEEYSQISLERQYAPPIFRPTGMFIQSIEFNSATNVRLTGYVWQRYQNDEAIPEEPQIVFAEAISVSLQDAYVDVDTSTEEVIKGWYFVTELNERFDYSYFPFDRQSVWIRTWSKDFGKNIVLIPDFASYDSLNPRSLPGLEKNFPLYSWEPEESYFNIRVNRYNSNFGQPNYTNRNAVPELYFNIDVRRNFLNPFVSHLFPLLIVLLMLFAITMTVSNREENSALLGFSVSEVVASCTALFFVLLIAHVQLRDELSSDRIVYLESYYFVSYLVILLTTANAILFAWDTSHSTTQQSSRMVRRLVDFVKYEHNLIPKLVYWPFISIQIFLFTAIRFWT